MQPNMSDIDRIARFPLAMIIFALYFFDNIPVGTGIPMILSGAYLFLTSYTGVSPLYWIIAPKTKHPKRVL
jgi:Protein of unknown function (DUF2892)